jgi:hypothetical protein
VFVKTVIMPYLISAVSKATVLQTHSVVNVNKIYSFAFNVKLQKIELLTLNLMYVFVKMDIIKIQTMFANHVDLDVLLVQVQQTALVVLLLPLQLMEPENAHAQQKHFTLPQLTVSDIVQAVQISAILVAVQLLVLLVHLDLI